MTEEIHSKTAATTGIASDCSGFYFDGEGGIRTHRALADNLISRGVKRL